MEEFRSKSLTKSFLILRPRCVQLRSTLRDVQFRVRNHKHYGPKCVRASDTSEYHCKSLSTLYCNPISIPSHRSRELWTMGISNEESPSTWWSVSLLHHRTKHSHDGVGAEGELHQWKHQWRSSFEVVETITFAHLYVGHPWRPATTWMTRPEKPCSESSNLVIPWRSKPNKRSL